jgi:DNA polymerase elongation subunit (family B)
MYYLSRNTTENEAIVQLSKEGKSIIGGQILRYIITDYEGGRKKRPIATPLELIDDKSTYDAKRYTELLAQTCNSVIEPFGYTTSNAAY